MILRQLNITGTMEVTVGLVRILFYFMIRKAEATELLQLKFLVTVFMYQAQASFIREDSGRLLTFRITEW